jgi:hypothetical protein
MICDQNAAFITPDEPAIKNQDLVILYYLLPMNYGIRQHLNIKITFKVVEE